jgi:ribose transport system substrate-binding protein
MRRMAGNPFIRFSTQGAVLLGVVALGVAACGGSSESEGSTQNSAAGAGCDRSYAQSQVDTFKKLPKFEAPGPAFDAGKARGKMVFNIQETSANPYTQSITAAIKEVASKYGIKFVDYPNQGQRTQWAQGVQTAISQKADVITLVGGTISPNYFKPQADAAEQAGIPLVTVTNEDIDQEPGYKVAARVAQPYAASARLNAHWVIADTNCKAEVLVLTSKEVIGSPAEVDAMKDEFAKRCGDGCKLTFSDVPVPDWPTKIQQQVQSGIQRSPKLNYIIPMYDGMTQFVLPGIQAAGAAQRVKVTTFNGTPFALRYIQTKTPLVSDVGENTGQVGYGAMDQAMRLLAGVDPIASGDEKIPLRIFDASNVDEAGTPPKLGKGYGDEYLTGYQKIWSGK